MNATAPSRADGAASRFLEAVSGLLGDERVLSSAAAGGRYGANTSLVRRQIAGAVLARTTDEVVAVVKQANQHRVALYPISTGHNWGYGSANPVTEGCIIVDLSGMNSVTALDPELGVVTIQPGVTQGILKSYLEDNHLDFLVPVHGGGPTCSILGNAVERGWGITPINDHFGAVTSLTAVLPNGEVYRRALHHAGAGMVNGVFKWGVGPYLDGLFTQSNLGIVTEMTIALARKPRRIEAFYFWVPEDSQLEQAVTLVRELLRNYAGIACSVNLMDRRRMLSMMLPFPKDRVPPGQTMPEEMVREFAGPRHVPAWTGAGALYGDDRVVRAARAGIKKLLRPVASRLLFMTMPKAKRLRRVLGFLPRRWGAGLLNMLDVIMGAQRVLEGGPSEVALPLAYWKSGRPRSAGKNLDPAADGCGLLWYSPLVPMKPATARTYVDTVRSVCPRHGIEPLITFTSVSERCFDSTVPILFDRASEVDANRAAQCYEELLAAGLSLGCFPYRFGIDHMQHVVDPKAVCWRLVSELKAALDPNQILAPGRYCPLPE
jgi:4-cresol dehydrogenase (hydroxylating) flavoprotein subunit